MHGTLSGPATLVLLERAWEVFGDARFERLAGLSNGHLYNLRRSHTYRQRLTTQQSTRPARVAIAERKRPQAEGRPGYVRVDSVHQGDLDKVKGVYHINTVDEVTQFEFLGSTEQISERYLLPVLESLLAAFPFRVLGVHADNGSEYINHREAARGGVHSRPRHSNDNALVESKNGSVVSSRLRAHPRTLRPAVACVPRCSRRIDFPSEQVDAKGKLRKRYRRQDIMTPYEKLKSLPDAERFLRDGIDFAQLDAVAYQHTDLEAARRLNAVPGVAGRGRQRGLRAAPCMLI